MINLILSSVSWGDTIKLQTAKETGTILKNCLEDEYDFLRRLTSHIILETLTLKGLLGSLYKFINGIAGQVSSGMFSFAVGTSIETPVQMVAINEAQKLKDTAYINWQAKQTVQWHFSNICLIYMRYKINYLHDSYLTSMRSTADNPCDFYLRENDHRKPQIILNTQMYKK